MKNSSLHSRIFLAGVLLTVAFLSILPVDRAMAGHPHQRDGWLLGMSYGYGRGRIKAFDSGDQYDFHDGTTPQIRFGHMLGDHLALHVEYGGWMLEDGILPDKMRISMQDVVLAATWFPGSPQSAWGGFYLRAGAGLGWASAALIEINEDLEQEFSQRKDETGLGLQFAFGYEWRIAHNTAAGLGLSLQHLDIGGEIFQNTTFVPLTFSLGWYWD